MGQFTKLRVWEDSIKLSTSIYRVTKSKLFARDFGLRDQIQRASVSIASNIAEGEERGSDRDAVRFFFIAKGSTAEVITQLIIANRIGYVDNDTAEELKDQAHKIAASLNNLIKVRKGRIK